VNKQNKVLLRPVAAACLLALGATGLPAHAQQISNDAFLTTVSIEIYPIAYLEFLDTPLLYLEVPPPGSTLPSNGVNFVVTGNASATLFAEPDAFIQVAGPKEWLGKAILGSEAIGYDIQLEFPDVGPGLQVAKLPGNVPDHTDPLTVDLTLTNGEREGVIHLLASHEWTPGGLLPLPGIYVGSVVLTLTADNI
jgi:hypothetical protein